MDLFFVLLVLYVFVPSILSGYAATWLTRRKWFGWMVGLGLFYWLGMMPMPN